MAEAKLTSRSKTITELQYDIDDLFTTHKHTWKERTKICKSVDMANSFSFPPCPAVILGL